MSIQHSRSDITMIQKRDRSNTKYDIFVEDSFSLPRGTIKLHWHAYYEIEIVLQGEGINHINGRAYPLKRGIISFLSPNDFHLIDTSTESISFKKLRFYPDNVSPAVLELLHSLEFPIRHQCSEDELLSLFHDYDKLALALKESRIGDTHSRCRLDCAVLEIVNLAASDKNAHPATAKTSHEQNHQEWIRRSLIFVDEHLSDTIARNDIADILHISPAYFSRLFHSMIGTSFENYILHRRIDNAKRLLQFTDLSIGDVAEECGFGSRTFFNRIFMRLVGITPSVYRNCGSDSE